MSFHLAIAAAWAIIVLVGSRSHGAGLGPALRSAALAGIVAFSLSLAGDAIFPDTPDCYEQTPTGRGVC